MHLPNIRFFNKYFSARHVPGNELGSEVSALADGPR